MKKGDKYRRWISYRKLNSFLACTAAMMLNGVPPVICESVLDEVYCSVRKSIGRIKP